MEKKRAEQAETEANKKEIFGLLDKEMFVNSTDLFPDSTTATSLVQKLYSSRTALWSNGSVLNSTATNFLQIITNAGFYGLDSNLYNLQVMRKLNDSLLSKPGNKSLLTQAEWEFSKSSILFLIISPINFLKSLVL